MQIAALEAKCKNLANIETTKRVSTIFLHSSIFHIQYTNKERCFLNLFYLQQVEKAIKNNLPIIAS